MATKKPKKQKIENINNIGLENGSIVETQSNDNRQKLYIKQPFKLTEKQIELIKTIQNENVKIVFIEGPAGSAKSFSSILGALQLFSNNLNYDKIIYIRSIVESADKSIGALPGTLEDKTAPFIGPLLDKLEQLMEAKDVKDMFKAKEIEFAPINFLRGADWKNKIIILDEAQDLSVKEIETVMTRLGKDSKLIICGDVRQSDIGRKSGFQKIMSHFECNIESQKWGLEFFRFGVEDILRSPFLKFLIEEIDKIKLEK